MIKTNYPSITPLTPTVGQSEITFCFNVISFADVTDLSYSIYNDEYPTVIVSSGTLEHTGEFWPYGEDFSVTASGLEYNSGTYVCVLSATNANGTTESAQKCTLKSYTDWADSQEVLDGNKFIGEDGEAHVGEIATKTATNVTFSNGNVNVPVGYYAEQVTKEYPEPVLETVPVTPTTSAQTITPSTGYDGIGTVNVSAVTSAIDANITAGNIKNGVTILGVTGTMTSGPGNYLELQLGDPDPWEDSWQNKYPFGGYLTLNLNDLTIPEGGTYSGNTPQDWVSDMEFLQCYLDAQHNDFFNVDCTSYNGMLDSPRAIGKAFITSDGTVIIPCTGGFYEFDLDTGEQTIPNYGNIPCGQTDLTGDFEVYAVTHLDPSGTPMYGVVATGTYFIPATQSC